MEIATDVIAVSIIMPSLNVVGFIDRALNSVVKQTLKNIEIICVDAGSTDGTYEIIEDYAARDRRILILKSDIKSYGYQVNEGIRSAGGKYVGIVETDDSISPLMYEELFRVAETNNLDYVRSDFWGVSAHKQTLYRCITADDRFYNKQIGPDEEGKLLSVEMLATWCGLYRRDFLIRNNIWHNETPGASYQDTGFYFLTYMYSKKISYVNKTFYRYTMDNASSSVNTTQKVFCICDEFEYVRRRMEEDRCLEKYKNLFCKFFYFKYKRNLERIKGKDRYAFLQRFREDYQKLDKLGWISWEKWNTEWREDLKLIIQTGPAYLGEIEIRREKFFQKLNAGREIVIFGAGVFGKRIYENVLDKSKIKCFAVSNTEGVEKNFRGMPVKQIDDVKKNIPDATIVLAIKNKETERQMEKRAIEIGFKNIVRIPYGLMDYE